MTVGNFSFKRRMTKLSNTSLIRIKVGINNYIGIIGTLLTLSQALFIIPASTHTVLAHSKLSIKIWSKKLMNE